MYMSRLETCLAKAAGADLPVAAVRVLGNHDVLRLDLPRGRGDHLRQAGRPTVLPAGKTLQLSKAQQDATVSSSAVMKKPSHFEKQECQGTSNKVWLYD